MTSDNQYKSCLGPGQVLLVKRPSFCKNYPAYYTYSYCVMFNYLPKLVDDIVAIAFVIFTTFGRQLSKR